MNVPAGYRNFSDLQQREREGIDFRIHIRRGTSDMAVIAPHGGGIEPGTLEIADAAAGDRHAFYGFEGMKPAGNFRLHIDSVRFDEPACLALVGGSRWAVAVHGCRGPEEAAYVGGGCRPLADALRARLSAAGFPADRPPAAGLKGRHPHNVCNRRPGGGAQIEISRGLRNRLFTGFGTRGAPLCPAGAFHDFVAALRAALDGFTDAR